MTSTMSARAMSSSMKCCGMRPKVPPPEAEHRGDYKESAQFLLDPCADRAHVRAPLRLRLHERHDLAHVLERAGAGGGDRLTDQRVDLGLAHLRGQVALQHRDLGGLLGD